MRLVVTTDCFLPRWDGIARFLSLLLPELSRSMHVTVFAPRFPGRLAVKGVRVVRFPLINFRLGDIFFCIPDKAIMADAISRSDVVFNQTIGPVGRAGILLANKFGKPVVSYVHSVEWELARQAVRHFRLFVGLFARFMARRLYNKCSLLLVPSREVAELLSANSISARKAIVGMGVLAGKFVPPKSKALAKKKLGISSTVFVVGFCGRIAREKDLPTLYSAFRLFRLRHPAAVLLIVGEGEVSSVDGVICVGAQHDVLPFLQAMDVFVLPSLTETSSLSTMEAMSVGLPVVVTPVGSVRNYVVDGKNGLFFSKGDASALAVHLDYLFLNSSVRSSLGSAARKTVVRKLSWSATVEGIKKVLSAFSG